MFFYVDCHVVKIIVYSKKNGLEKIELLIAHKRLSMAFFGK